MRLSRRNVGLIVAVTVLPGCMKDMTEGGVSRFLGGAEPRLAETSDAPGVRNAVVRSAEVSPIIHALRTRPSVLVPGTPYDRVAQAVIASDAHVAEAELRVARLRAEAAEKNWLPRIGPRISLDSLGAFVADLVVQQVLFDNGRKLAERDLAKSDVELAAVTLVEDGNRRVFDALSLYLTVQENRELRAHLDRADAEMAHFEWVMTERVRGGVSDMSDLNVIRQKRAATRARATEAAEAALAAQAELDAMAGYPVESVTGMGGLRVVPTGEALDVLRAQGERDRALAQARIARAGHLPGLTASAATDGSAGLEVMTDSLFGLGTMAELQAIDATRDLAERRVTEARETAQRQVASQTRQLEAYRRQADEARGLTTQAAANLDLFRKQYEGGQRQVMDVVGVYETHARALETEIDLRFKAARAELELARLRGALAEGARI
ncbi:TolC family protein [Thetidibacter halocola]|uniref:TolC family protein n=1 Tax=Thetidibacter halocola TaxID=2827239 RepID=A0A8J7WH75_9RHOB|nr:TolC family protein [Thetidibacter halocola]MBS0125601.1 TolC family protein [Thetidibacter halocola]